MRQWVPNWRRFRPILPFTAAVWPLLIVAIPFLWYFQETGTPFSYGAPFTEIGLKATDDERWAQGIYTSVGLYDITTFSAAGTPDNLPLALVSDFRLLPSLVPFVLLSLLIGLLVRRSGLWRFNALLVIFFYVSWVLGLEMREPRHYFFIVPFVATGAALGLTEAVRFSMKRARGRSFMALLVFGVLLLLSLPYQYVAFSYLDFLEFPQTTLSFLGKQSDWYSDCRPSAIMGHI